MKGEAVRSHAHARLVLSWAPLVVLAAAGLWFLAPHPKPAESRVSAAAFIPSSGLRSRPVEARLTGLPWAPFVSEAASTAHDAKTRGNDQDAQQQQGLAELLLGEPRNAVAFLERASIGNDSAVLSDLSAAYYEAAIRYDAPEFLANALAAADRALATLPEHTEALFNRALILERLGLRADAYAAWTRYLKVEVATDWASEARKHRDAVAPQRPFLEVLDESYDRIGSDPAAAAAFYERDRFGARGQGVVEVLGRWGDALLRGDERDAARHLNVARQLGHAVARGGDLTLERAVAVIDEAGDRRAILAAAHADFTRGMKAYQSQNAEQAEPLLRGAADAFDKMGSPVRYAAALWAAIAMDNRGRADEAEKEIGTLVAATPREYPAYRGFMLWQLANRRKARGEWGEAMALYDESTALFEQIGEMSNVANVRSIVSAVYDNTGDPETAWRNRIAALRIGGIRENDIVERAVWSVVETAIARRDWHVASSFLAVYVEVTRRLHNEVELATALWLRALVCSRLGDAAGVETNVQEARAASRVKDSSYREQLRVLEWRSTAMLDSTPPLMATELLTRVIEYESTKGQPNALSGLYLLRARARRGSGDVPGALEDVQRGIERLERNRESLPVGAARWGAFAPAEELFDEAVDLSMSAGDSESAFRFTEKGRARSLLDAYGAVPDGDLQAIPPRTVVVEYAVLPASLVIFVADANGLSAVKVDATREAVVREVAALNAALAEDEMVNARRAAASLYKRIVDPIAWRLAGAETVVFVPDATTSAIPFSALVDGRGNYFVRSHAIVRAPSTASFLAAGERRARMSAVPRSVLVLTASAPAANAGALQYVDREAREILRLYRSPARLDEDSAQFEELKTRASAADIIHVSAHAVGDPRGYEPASIVLRSNGEERRVGVGEIAALRLDRTSVVVLAGCSTAEGRQRTAEGVVSVAHGFLSAGVPSAVATLWPIDDRDAAVFFPRLHKKLAAGVAPAEALRETQLEFIESGDVPPSLWAAVQVIGN